MSKTPKRRSVSVKSSVFNRLQAAYEAASKCNASMIGVMLAVTYTDYDDKFNQDNKAKSFAEKLSDLGEAQQNLSTAIQCVDWQLASSNESAVGIDERRFTSWHSCLSTLANDLFLRARSVIIDAKACPATIATFYSEPNAFLDAVCAEIMPEVARELKSFAPGHAWHYRSIRNQVTVEFARTVRLFCDEKMLDRIRFRAEQPITGRPLIPEDEKIRQAQELIRIKADLTTKDCPKPTHQQIARVYSRKVAKVSQSWVRGRLKLIDDGAGN